MDFKNKIKEIEIEFEKIKKEIEEVDKRQNQLAQIRMEKVENLARLRGQFEIINELKEKKKQKRKTK